MTFLNRLQNNGNNLNYIYFKLKFLGIDIGILDEYQDVLLKINSNSNRFNLVKVLLEQGVNHSSYNWDEIFHTVMFQDMERLQKVITIENINLRDERERTPFLLAVEIGSLEKAKLLYENGADPFLLSEGEKSALIDAVENNDVQMLKWLLSLGLEIDVDSYFLGTPIHFASEINSIESVEFLLSKNAKIEYSREYYSEGLEENTTSTYKAVNNAFNLKMARIFLAYGAELKDISYKARDELLQIEKRELETKVEVYHQQKKRVFGRANPELTNHQFWLDMIASGVVSYTPRAKYNDIDCPHPIWSYERYGRTITELKDGRIIEIGGEHEDYYDEDFMIYNDVVVYNRDKSIDIYSYPKEIFPPIDFHTATLVDDNIYIIGSLGYIENREDITPIYCLSINNFSIKKIVTTNHIGWISDHSSKHIDNTIVVTNGSIWDNEKLDLVQNNQTFILDLKNLSWKKKSL